MFFKRLFGTIIVLALIAAVVFYMLNKDEDTKPVTSATNNTTIVKEPVTSLESTVVDLATSAASVQTCGYTPDATAGPYYITGTRALTDGRLNYTNLTGSPIRIGGYVYGSDSNTNPISGAKVEIWQADNTGKYHPQNQGESSAFKAEDISLRGYVTSDSKGYYEFTSILPAEYEGRTRHIHVKATATGYQVRTSQIIAFQSGDKTAPEIDSIAKDFPTCNKISFTESNGIKTSIFNFHIQKQ